MAYQTKADLHREVRTLRTEIQYLERSVDSNRRHGDEGWNTAYEMARKVDAAKVELRESGEHIEGLNKALAAERKAHKATKDRVRSALNEKG